jgi:hypothetical protein
MKIIFLGTWARCGTEMNTAKNIFTGHLTSTVKIDIIKCTKCMIIATLMFLANRVQPIIPKNDFNVFEE